MIKLRHDVARVGVLIATKDGESTIADTIRSVAGQADVYVVSDGSTDATARVALDAGARVFALAKNVGKPAAIYRAIKALQLTKAYDLLAILDDDTIVAPNFIEEARKSMKPGVAIVVGRTITRWGDDRPWNVWLGCRAYAYWRYQLTIRRAQSAFNVLNCISGSNSVYRSELLDQVLVERTPYIVDDTYWTLETHRRKLGRIVYAPRAHAFVQDPTTFGAWYKQNLRWMWGTFQGIWGHRCGRTASRFDFAYLLLMLDWFFYVLGGPLVLGLVLAGIWWNPLWLLIGTWLGYFVWTIPAAIAIKKWRLVFMTPAFIAIDWLYRLVFLHAFLKTIRRPSVQSCRWESPPRY